LRDLQEIILIYISATTVALMIVLAIFGAKLEFLNGTSYGNISVEQAKMLIESDPSMVLVDVRTASEFSSGHIEGAVNLCVCNEEELLHNLESRDEILVYCLSGTRSLKAMMILSENGYSKVYNMLGGIIEWIEKDYPVIEG